ncbi:2Fe-2S iron-sulfur cluster-binding protein [Pseudovibrio sp. Tun.PSC04-5.I4]|uniref:2Fe-2S iron-sulfur cluster-binding protein n=1 Tax=Pseudovibrio sp. Tun.PSC04-5.I4 TaxID=1798213 RepID=UPI00088E29FB|nr:2Fe-2S iron-sulfur cluster-binding protein [Pseudovibrio sp. Tun.PSC04-5.I4]SDR21292.1 2Fe-2S iron-sulfur cluster binding domain-containing protein [Pseudovibrio sp. Tun.PSC04-5.I4]
MTNAIANLSVNGKQVEAKLGERLLEAAERAGISLHCDCGTCVCESSRVTVISGNVEANGTRLKSTVLACKATVAGDAEIMLPASSGLQSLKGHVSALRKVSDDLYELRLSFTKPISWRPGQYYHVEFRGHERINLSASFSLDAGTEFNTLIFLIEEATTPDLFAMLVKKGDVKGRVGITGPYGSSFLGHDDERLIMVAGPNSLAPIWAIALSSVMGQPRREKVLILDRSLEDAKFQQVFNWLKRRGLLPVFADLQSGTAEANLKNLLPDLTEFDMAYVAGSRSFIAGLESVFVDAQATYARIPQFQPWEAAVGANADAVTLEPAE